jgi:hypothetical protein
MFTIFGGPVYAAVVVGVVGLRRSKEKRHGLRSSVA